MSFLVERLNRSRETFKQLEKRIFLSYQLKGNSPALLAAVARADQPRPRIVVCLMTSPTLHVFRPHPAHVPRCV